ncbi:hypothetical protein FHR83_006758 [Actinoplanes campanulatus]|uniref:DUF6891 domain-containing protein n=1 Tax=Actinoplanes campanulatus TaxID=113559 RepID=A0A7W5AMZ8_9ACTN|nr:hypothetical protein [Actinoplanes campanulatus]MBB3099052.1 hypothetical protein [Actinoplanes campanulatus]GGN39248.1 hypothetical protein GCM10010109_66990 [Actinoplanes campanulatus]GID40210.1 hypothetical protein Aca09nite_67160 [Actinoplanes campanulatus]
MTGTDRERLDTALANLRGQGVAVVVDLSGSSGVRDWDHADYLKAAATAGTGRWVGTHVGCDEHRGAYWDADGTLRYGHTNKPVTEVWLHHSHPEVARLLVDALAAAGLAVSWDGNPDSSVLLALAGGR